VHEIIVEFLVCVCVCVYFYIYVYIYMSVYMVIYKGPFGYSMEKVEKFWSDYKVPFSLLHKITGKLMK
jgi:hypothetical protein